jgi:hypothetical protein
MLETSRTVRKRITEGLLFRLFMLTDLKILFSHWVISSPALKEILPQEHTPEAFNGLQARFSRTN